MLNSVGLLGSASQQHSVDDLLCSSHNSRDKFTTFFFFKMMEIDFYL